MKKDLCRECGKKRERCRKVVRQAGGGIEYCCPQCWRDLGYGNYLYEDE